MSSFEKVTAISGNHGRYSAELDPLWTVGGRPNGGYLLAIMARAAIAASAEVSPDRWHPYPLSASVLYVTSPEVGPAQLEVEPLRAGWMASQCRVRLTQDDAVKVEALFALGRLPRAGAAPLFLSTPPVDVSPPEECRLGLPEVPNSNGMRVEILSQVEQHIDRRSLKDPAFAGDLRGWINFLDGASFDPVSLLYACDCLPPSTMTMGSVGWVPTLELTAYIRAVPVPGRLRVRQRARLLTGGLVDQICEVWDSADQLVAQATQLAAVRMVEFRQ